MGAYEKAPGATAIAPGAGSVDLAGATLPLTPIRLKHSSGYALAWIAARHHVRPERAGIIVEAARLGGRA